MSVYSRPIVFLVVAVVVISVGTLITTFIPLLNKSNVEAMAGIKPYNALELTGRDIYVREGCNNCHTQTVRPLKFETDRYGAYSRGGEFVYDRPFLWGSKRTGPDLAREGGRYPDSWHYTHFKDPRSLVPESNMPAYSWLVDTPVNPAVAEKKMQSLGFPYTPAEISALNGKTEMDALVAYMQKLGADYKAILAANAPKATTVALAMNPHSGDMAAAKEGEEIFEVNCSACHGKGLEGGIGPKLKDNPWLATAPEGEVFKVIMEGKSGGMPSFSTGLGADKAWKVVTFLKSGEHTEKEAHEGHH